MLRLQRYLEIQLLVNKTKKHHFTLKVPTAQQNFILIGLQAIIEMLIISLPVMEFYLIMNHPEEEILLLQKR